MNDMILKKNRFGEFISLLISESLVAAPVKKGESCALELIDEPDEIDFKTLPPLLPPKKYLIPQKETLLEFDSEFGQDMRAVVDVEELIIFGARTCDIEGMQCLSSVFTRKPKDEHFIKRKSMLSVIGLECMEKCDKYASCVLMNCFLPKGGYDLMFTDLGDYFYVGVNTDKGEDIIELCSLFENAEAGHVAELNNAREKKKAENQKELDCEVSELPELFRINKKSEVWETTGHKCLSCGNCTNVCPTCYCFDVMDELDLNLTTGRRVRVWDSCQNESFATVAGGENFRENRADRKRHRFHRKFDYPVEKFGRFFCTGCGRCSRLCMANIDLKNTIKELMNQGVK